MLLINRTNEANIRQLDSLPMCQTGMTIREVFWTQKDGNVSANTWLIKRGANTVLVCPGNSGHFKFDGMQIENSFEKASNVNFVTTGLGTLILKLKKTSGEV